MINWYAVYYGKQGCNAWYASSPDKATAERWVKELYSKGYVASIDVIKAPSDS